MTRKNNTPETKAPRYKQKGPAFFVCLWFFFVLLATRNARASFFCSVRIKRDNHRIPPSEKKRILSAKRTLSLSVFVDLSLCFAVWQWQTKTLMSEPAEPHGKPPRPAHFSCFCCSRPQEKTNDVISNCGSCLSRRSQCHSRPRLSNSSSSSSHGPERNSAMRRPKLYRYRFL